MDQNDKLRVIEAIFQAEAQAMEGSKTDKLVVAMACLVIGMVEALDEKLDAMSNPFRTFNPEHQVGGDN